MPNPSNQGLLQPVQCEWLVSVRNQDEWSLASKYPIDIIDFKEPDRGPLAPVDPSIWHQVVAAGQPRQIEGGNRMPYPTSQISPRQVPAAQLAARQLSAALGERDQMMQVADQVPESFQFAKVGPSGCDSIAKTRSLWEAARQRLPASVELVAVAYADHEQAACLPSEEVFDLARTMGIRRCLIDTFAKTGQSTIDILGTDRLQKLSAQTRSHGQWWALAGSIRLEHLTQLAACQIHPHCVGIRGDVCDQARTSALSTDRLDRWSECRLASDQLASRDAVQDIAASNDAVGSAASEAN